MNHSLLRSVAAMPGTAGRIAQAALMGDGEALGPLFDCLSEEGNAMQSLEVGKPYLVQTVTHYYTGRLERVSFAEIVLTEAAWIPDTGRLHQFLRTGKPQECEPLPGKVTLNMGCVVSVAEFFGKLPSEVL